MPWGSPSSRHQTLPKSVGQDLVRRLLYLTSVTVSSGQRDMVALQASPFIKDLGDDPAETWIFHFQV